MKYRCLIFDHDDTVVNSTATIHHPAFLEFLKIYRPGMTCSLEEYFCKNFDPGFVDMCLQDYSMSMDELHQEEDFWRAYVANHIPEAYPGIKEIMDEQKRQGGLIAVISHSMKENILRDYAANGLPEPDIIFGWEQPPERRKPNAWPLLQVLETFDLGVKDALMIDDLKPGYDMARSVGVDFAAVGWSNDVASIERFMRANCENYFKSVAEFRAFLQ